MTNKHLEMYLLKYTKYFEVVLHENAIILLNYDSPFPEEPYFYHIFKEDLNDTYVIASLPWKEGYELIKKYPGAFLYTYSNHATIEIAFEETLIFLLAEELKIILKKPGEKALKNVKKTKLEKYKASILKDVETVIVEPIKKIKLPWKEFEVIFKEG